MKKSIFLLSSVLVFFLLAGSSCFQVQTGGGDRGIFKSVDRGERWQKKTSLLSLAGKADIGGVNATSLVLDPRDSGTLYLGTRENGFFTSIDAADSWRKIKRLPSGEIKAIAPHPQASQIVYLATENKIFRSANCCRTFENLYLETKPDVEITSLVVHPTSFKIIYSGLSDGRLLKSVNGGYSWNTLHKFKGGIKQILVNPKNAAIIYIFYDKDIFKSEDAGRSWFSLSDSLEEFSGGNKVIKAIFVSGYIDSLIMATQHGLLLTHDGGKTWSAYKLLTASGKAKISSFVIDPHNPNVIYYISGPTLYKTIDGGMNWVTRPLPSKQQIVDIVIDPANSNILYLIYQKEKKDHDIFF